MNVYSAHSLAQLETCHSDLQHLFKTILPFYDHTIIQGHRNEEDQNRAVEDGKSKLRWPKGKHNSFPSRAVDAAPYPVLWPSAGLKQEENERRMRRFFHFAGFVEATAIHLNIALRYGGDWNGDRVFDESFVDAVHFELKGVS